MHSGRYRASSLVSAQRTACLTAGSPAAELHGSLLLTDIKACVMRLHVAFHAEAVLVITIVSQGAASIARAGRREDHELVEAGIRQHDFFAPVAEIVAIKHRRATIAADGALVIPGG